MGSLMYFNSRIYAKILETRRLRERCKIRSSTTLALKEIKSDNNSNTNAAVPEAHNVTQEKSGKRHEAMSSKDFKMARVLLSIVLVFFVCHLLRLVFSFLFLYRTFQRHLCFCVLLLWLHYFSQLNAN